MKITGLPSDGAKAFYLFENFILKGTPLVFVTKTDENVEISCENLAAAALYFQNPLPNDKILRITEDRFDVIQSLFALSASQSAKIIQTPETQSTFYISATPASLSAGVIPLSQASPPRLIQGKEFPRHELLDYLSKTGYERTDFVEDFGNFSVRGEIIDFWPAGAPNPVRLVFSGDIIESIRTFDVETQRTRQLLEFVNALPASVYDASGTLADYLPKNTAIFIDEGIEDNELPEWILSYRDFNRVSAFEGESAGYARVDSFAGNLDLFRKQLAGYRSNDYKITIFCSNYGESERLSELLGAGAPEIVVAPLTQGFIHADKKIAALSYNDIYGRAARPARMPKFKSGKILEGLWEISSGDYVVHEHYGIGRYKGLRQIAVGSDIHEFLLLEYRGGDKLYVPIYDFRKVQKYIGVEGRAPRLFSMDSPSWEKVKIKARESANELAKQLLELYNIRKSAPGEAFCGDPLMEKILADSFTYEETDDQKRAIEEVSRDLESPSPMDRLVLGDVGFGKTEVAVRGAFKAALSGKQTALLCPTTILAEQHHEVFSRRLSPFPVTLGLLTRFQTRAQQKKTIEELKKGLVDIVIGTHRLLQKDIAFKNLGLLIIDEEHRFGVKQKEQIKMFRKNIDALSLTATPIPRTLSMSLSGMKDLSLIETPPEGRLSIETNINAYSDDQVKKAILNETGRGGQVFYVHNYIFSIKARLTHLENLLPGVRFAMIHGRMPAKQIEKTMHDFSRGEYDCLLTTTIIESGIDLPNVNTMLIERAEEFGLAQLYQLRGRIGRGRSKAHCYLLFSTGTMTEEAKKRLAALREFTHIGSGMRLALRDMEIRGAGEILGKKQHGYVRDIGLDLYSKYLTEEVGRLRGAPALPKSSVEKEMPEIELNASAYIPDDYIRQDEIRITFYRRFIAAENTQELGEILKELEDRFGKIPETVKNLAGIVEIKWLAEKLRLSKVSQVATGFEFTLSENAKAEKLVDFLLKKYPKDVQFTKKGFRIIARDAGLPYLMDFLVSIFEAG